MRIGAEQAGSHLDAPVRGNRASHPLVVKNHHRPKESGPLEMYLCVTRSTAGCARYGLSHLDVGGAWQNHACTIRMRIETTTAAWESWLPPGPSAWRRMSTERQSGGDGGRLKRSELTAARRVAWVVPAGAGVASRKKREYAEHSRGSRPGLPSPLHQSSDVLTAVGGAVGRRGPGSGARNERRPRDVPP